MCAHTYKYKMAAAVVVRVFIDRHNAFAEDMEALQCSRLRSNDGEDAPKILVATKTRKKKVAKVIQQQKTYEIFVYFIHVSLARLDGRKRPAAIFLYVKITAQRKSLDKTKQKTF